MKRILFVDDEKLVLDGLRRSLYPLRTQWKMEFCDSPAKACELVATNEFDVVVSDMRMPGMDGAHLLAHVAQVRPSALRVILSGQSDMESTVRAAIVAHQFMSKPCDGKVLDEVLGRTLKLHQLLEDPELRTLMSRIKGLPAPPRTYQTLAKLVSDPDVEFDRVAEAVGNDIGLIAKLLQLVNSSFFGLARHVSSVRDAVSILGMDRIKSLVLCTEVYRTFDEAELPVGFDFEAETRHAQCTAQVARSLLKDKARAEFAYLAAMLHDIGTWVLAACEPAAFAELATLARQRGTTLDEVDDQGARLPHARLGAYLLGIWNLPYPVVEAVAFHHRPSAAGVTTFDALGAVHVADCLTRAAAATDPAEVARHLQHLDQEFLAAAGIADRIPEWLEAARNTTAKAA